MRDAPDSCLFDTSNTDCAPVHPTAPLRSFMRLNSTSQLALTMRGEAGRTGGTASVRLSVLRATLGSTMVYRWVSPETEVRSITRFAQSNGFEYLSQTTRNGQQVCNFWFVPN